MKTKSVFLLLLVLVAPSVCGQSSIPVFKHNSDRSKPFPLVVNYEPWNQSFKESFNDGVYYQNRHDRYEGIRVGEYYWMTTNLRNQKTHSDSWDSRQEKVDIYMGHVRVNATGYQGLDQKVDPLNPDAEIKYSIFDYYYGRYYHMMNLNGYKVHHWYHESIDESFKVYYLDGQNKEISFDGWKVADKQAYQQLIGMCNPGGKSYIVGAIGVRLQLGPLNKNDQQTKAKPWLTNPLAYDLGPAQSQPSWCKTYWFEQNSNIYGFNLMPNGGKIHGGTHYENIDGFDSWTVGGEEFYQLFYVAKMGWRNGGLDLHDEITFYPQNPESSGDTESESGNDPSNWGYSWGTRYGARMARALTPQELGYEIWYIPGVNQYGDIVEKGMPDFRKPDLKITENVNGKVVKPEKPKDSKLDWQILPHGYLRGFFSHYEIYDTEQKKQHNYVFADYVKMARCVEDTWSMARLKETQGNRDIEPCDCYDVNSAPYIQDNLKMDAFDDNYSFERAPGSTFNVYALTYYPEETAIGLFSIEGTNSDQKLNLIGRISKEYDPATNQYRCTLPPGKIGSGYIIQAYKLDNDGNPSKDSNGYIATVKRPSNKPEIIDRLPLTIGENKISGEVQNNYLNNLILIRNNDSDKNSYSIPVDEKFIVQLKDITSSSPNIEIGLFSELTGELVDKISINKLADNRYECVIAGATILPYNQYILSAYTGNANSNNITLIDRTSNILDIDRLPVFVEYNDNWDSDTFSILKSINLLSSDESTFNLSFNLISNLLSIKSDSPIKQVSVYNISGFRALNISKPASDISLSVLPSGTYIVKAVLENSETKTIKIIKR